MKTENLQIDPAEATHGKRSLQAALELVRTTRAGMLPGRQADALDHAERLIVVGITVLRDADRTAHDSLPPRPEEKRKARSSAFESRPTVKVKCPGCKQVFESRAVGRTSCGCGQMSINIKKHQVKTP
jgi:hypothetical protein